MQTPAIFILILNILVLKVAKDGVYSNIPFNAWYLDDGCGAVFFMQDTDFAPGGRPCLTICLKQ